MDFIFNMEEMNSNQFITYSVWIGKTETEHPVEKPRIFKYRES